MPEQDLAGLSILIVEDEYYAADDLRRELTRLGVQVVGPVPTLERALRVIDDTPRIDCAVLDINLGGEMVFPAADLLQARGVPFLFSTGYDRTMIPSRFADVVRCEKPLGPEKPVAALKALLSSENP